MKMTLHQGLTAALLRSTASLIFHMGISKLPAPQSIISFQVGNNVIDKDTRIDIDPTLHIKIRDHTSGRGISHIGMRRHTHIPHTRTRSKFPFKDPLKNLLLKLQIAFSRDQPWQHGVVSIKTTILSHGFKAKGWSSWVVPIRTAKASSSKMSPLLFDGLSLRMSSLDTLSPIDSVRLYIFCFLLKVKNLSFIWNM